MNTRHHRTETKPLAKRTDGDQLGGLTPEQVDLIKRTVARNATDDELRLFLYQCKRTGLDPLLRQMHFIRRRQWNAEAQSYEMVGTMQTGIDGLRLIAERTGLYRADDEKPRFTYANGAVASAIVRVYKYHTETKQWHAVEIEAFWDEYAQRDKDGKPVALWARMPHVMLAKVAESLALRKAFPQDLSGIYAHEELPAADPPAPGPNRASPVEDASADPLGVTARIFSPAKGRNWNVWWPAVKAAAIRLHIAEYQFISDVVGHPVSSVKDEVTDEQFAAIYRQALDAGQSTVTPPRAAATPDPLAGPNEDPADVCEHCGKSVPPDLVAKSMTAAGRVLCGPHLLAAQAGKL